MNQKEDTHFNDILDFVFQFFKDLTDGLQYYSEIKVTALKFLIEPIHTGMYFLAVHMLSIMRKNSQW